MISNFLYNLKNTDKTTLFISFFIIVFFGFYVNQLPLVIVGIVIIFVFSSLSLRFIIRLSLIGLCITSILCVAILFFDYEILGSKRWIVIFDLPIKPSNFLIPFFIVCSARLLDFKSKEFIQLRYNIIFNIFLFTSILILLQPDFGLTFLFALTFFTQLFVAGLSIFLILFALIMLVVLCISSYLIFDHVQRRIDIFLDPGAANYYQIDLSLMAFKSGGIFGKGPFQGRLIEKIPDANTDFIFARIGEEFGLLGCSLLMTLFLIVIIKSLIRSLQFKNNFIFLSIVGLITYFALQIIINTSSSLGIIPTKGLNLPLVSYGMNSLISTCVLRPRM